MFNDRDVLYQLTASLQAQLDEMREALVQTRQKLDDLTEQMLLLSASTEWLADETARPGMVRDRIITRIAESVRALEELQTHE